MYAVKANRQYTITEAEIKGYQAQGYDIIGNDGEVLQHGAGKTVPYAKYRALQNELEALKAAKPDNKATKELKAELAEIKEKLAAANAELEALKKA